MESRYQNLPKRFSNAGCTLHFQTDSFANEDIDYLNQGYVGIHTYLNTI